MEALKAVALPPGFGFHPTDVELISHYLKRKNQGLKVDFEVIPELDIYKREPWDLPACCQIPTRDSKWHFFTSRDRKYPNGSRSNRATEAGYWKSTGKDRSIKLHNRVIGTKKTLVFHQGRPPYGKRTDWIMHEYYVDEKESKTTPGIKDTYVLCRVTKRNGFAVEGENVSAQTEDVDDCQKVVKNVDTSLQEGVGHEESSPSASTEDLDAWFEELFDPNFDGSIESNITDLPASIEQKSELQTGLSTLIPKDEPLDFGILPEEIIGILHDDFAAMPEITELLTVDCNSTLSPNHQIKFGTEDFKREIHVPSDNAKFTGIQIRDRRERLAAETFRHRFKLEVQTSKMESRNSTSVRQTFKFAHVNHCISSNSKPQQPPKFEINKILYRETKLNCIQGFINEFWRFPSRCLTDGIDCCFLRVCLIGAVVLIIYFLLDDCLHFFGSFPALGL